VDCLDENTVAALFDETLPPDEKARVDEHVDACSPCRLLLGRLAGMFDRTSDAEATREAPEDAPNARIEEARIAKGTSVGRYVVLATLGAGGMGIVFSAFDPELDRKVALKLVRADAHATAGTRDFFARRKRWRASRTRTS